MRLSAGFKTGFIKAAVHSGLSEKQANAWLNLFHYGTPVAAGGVAGYTAHQQGASLPLSGAIGLGATQLASPRRWGEIYDLARQAKDPFTAGSREILKDVAIKSAIPAGVGVMETVPEILHNVKDTTGNTSAITGSFAKDAPNLSKNVNSTMEGMGQFWDPKKGVGPQLANSANDIAGTLKTEIPKITNAASSLSNQASGALNTMASIPAGINELSSSIRKGYQGLTPGQKTGLGVGAGGLGALLLAKMMTKKKQPRRTEIIEY